ncbi:tyrosine-type recombinase/integrase [Candidatus Woesearchaeota archaeon]|nr:tyrosine-type recombinase/integrase [Candidatus Woesearchaeota archaeon]
MDELYALKRECLRRGFSHKTILSYSSCVKLFFRKCRKDPRKVTKKDVLDYLDSLVDKEAAGSTVNVNLCALKFFFGEVLHKRLLVRIKFSKRPRALPIFLTKEEVVRLFEAVSNPKHRLILELIYSAGLRVSEAVKLKVSDLDFQRGVGWVRRGKGGKDRPFIISQAIRPRLEEQARRASENGALTYLFAGWKSLRGNEMGLGSGKTHLSVRSVQEIVKAAAAKASILKNVHPHSLRHSFATHLIENGYDVCAVQPLLGHSSAETTLTYLHMASPALLSVRSPYDELQGDLMNGEGS